jgi:T4 RnlA family RNA ligase
MFVTDIGYYCARHENWAEELTQEPYYIKIKEDGPYVMFSYDQIRSDFSYNIVREARGIIFRRGEWEQPVCWAFNKFGNYGESYAPEIDWETAFVTEKIDGSLIKVWWDAGYWHVSTNGTIDAFKAEINNVKMKNFGDYFMSAIEKYYDRFDDFFRGLETHRTYMFELVGPYNRVVIPYEETDLYFLGARTNASGEEYYCSSIVAGALGLGKFKRPAVYSLSSLEDCIKAAELKTWDDEGFVVADANNNRVKIKSPAYVLAHFMRNNNVITRKHLIRVVIENEVAEFLCYAADYKDELLKVQGLINAYHKVGNDLAQACRQMILLERKDYARLVQALPKIYHGLLYMNYDRFVSAQEYTSKWNENKWEEYILEMERLNNEYFKC